MKKILTFMIIALALVCFVSCSKSSEDVSADASPKTQQIVFKFALQQGQDHPLSKATAKFGEELEKLSGGRMKLQLFYSGTLGDKPSTVQGLKTGTIDAAMLMSGVIADFGCPQLKVFTLPYLFDSVDHARRFEKSDEGRALFDSVQSSGTKIVCLGAYQESARNYFFTSKDVQHPADMKNMMIRCQEGSVYYDSVEALGASAQSVAFSELFSALQSGVVDGAEQPLSGFVSNAYHEICKYYVLDMHEISPNLTLFSEVTWNKLSAEDQQIIMDAFEASVPYFEELSDAEDANYMQTMLDAGVKVTEVDVSEWQDACSSVYDKYGDEFADIISQINAVR